ncbi:MAG: hypothetical protein ACRC46_06700 [Thermoguttaceae bacterium]
MKDQITTSIVSALVGGAVAAIAIFAVKGNESKFDTLEVGSLKVTKDFTMHPDKAEAPLVVIKDGGTVTSGALIANHLMANQVSGSVLVANRLFTTPDNLANTPMNQWRFFTEMGASPTAGGELIVRSPQGAFIAGNPAVENGQFVRVGFDANDLVQVFAANNATKQIAPIAVQQPQQAAAATDQTSATPTDSTAPAAPYDTATAPTGGATR